MFRQHAYTAPRLMRISRMLVQKMSGVYEFHAIAWTQCYYVESGSPTTNNVAMYDYV